MSPSTLLRPLISAERRVVAGSRRRLGLAPRSGIADVVISEEEILADLLYRGEGAGRTGVRDATIR